MTDNKSIIQGMSGVEEVWEQVSRYLVYRGGREITVTVLDRGDEHPQIRYMATAEAIRVEDDRRVYSQSNPESSADEAIFGIHWQDFD